MAYILGLDLGARSLGWAAIVMEGNSGRFLGAGVRVFEAGVEGSLETGREESRSAQRRMARLARRQTRRRRQRARQLYHALSEVGLLPAVNAAPGRPEACEIQAALNRLDGGLRSRYASSANVNQLPYLLRARALDERLEPYELGRAFYHLGQRRGFQSNRKAKAKGDDEERDKVYAGIHDLETRLAGKRTLGEYLAGLDPAQGRIRSRYTHRGMYEREFEAIFAAQQPHHPCLTPEFKDRLSEILFFQRPLQDSNELIGRCEWDPAQRRTQLWRPEYQRFRILQTANHLRVVSPDGESRRLEPDERQRLVGALELAREVGVSRAKRVIGIPANCKFSIEGGGETKFKGDGVAAQMSAQLGAVWDQADPAARTAILEGLAAAGTDEDAAELLVRHCGLSPDEAQKAAENIALPSGYASLSLASLRMVLPFLEQGLSVQEARQAAGFALTRTTPVHDLLPPLSDKAVREAGIEVRNPAVARALTEMRKVVNAVVRRWGKPDEIHIEMARELKKTQEQRRKDVKTNRDRENERDRARRMIETEAGMARIGRKEIELALLYEECGGHCPYTGKPLGGLASILGGQAAVQVEHIIPRSISLDDSFSNLTLATVEANREKGNRTPWEAYGAEEQRFEGIIERVKTFRGAYARRKLERFQMKQTGKDELLEEFSSRQLNDTRYSSRIAAEYLGLLYGGEISNGKRNVLKATGQVTADLRGVWNLNEILSGDGRKSRDDHRHHAIDAAVLAVLNQGWIQRLSLAAETAWQEKKRRYASVEPPWVGFKEGLKTVIDDMHISYRPEHRVSGALHKDSNYALVGKNDKDGDVVRIRKPVHRLSKDEVEKIVDEGVRVAVQAKLSLVGDLKKLEADPPYLENRNGPRVPIRNVRIELNRAVRPVGRGYKSRFAEGGESHHVEVCEVPGKRTSVWRGEIVPMSEAMERIVKGREVIDRGEGPGRRFLFSLCKGDTVELRNPAGVRTGIWVVRKIMANQQILLVPERDARLEKEREQFAPTVSGLAKLNARKVTVDPLGRVLDARD